LRFSVACRFDGRDAPSRFDDVDRASTFPALAYILRQIRAAGSTNPSSFPTNFVAEEVKSSVALHPFRPARRYRAKLAIFGARRAPPRSEAMQPDPTGERASFLATATAGRIERYVAFSFAAASCAIFLALAPYAKLPLPKAPTFIPAYEAALAFNDVITAALLVSQFTVLRMRGLLLLACGYLFTALLAVAHLLSFPGLITPTGLISAGAQTTAWIYMFWHAGFPILVIGYALGRNDRLGETTSARWAIVGAAALTVSAAAALTALAVAGHDLLPAIMKDNGYRPAMALVISTVWLLSFCALLALLRRRPYSALDLWLIVVVLAWLFDIALSAGLNSGRFDLGFYAGRLYGLGAASFVLLALLTRHGALYARLAAAHERERRLAAELRRLSTTDALTGLANRRAFELALDSEWRRTLRYKTPLSLLLIDVDHFKRFNDAYGHPAGDECLRQVAAVLAHNARRAGEVAARYGGEEFALLAPHVETADARRLAERICQQVRDLALPHAASPTAPYVTVSVGVAGAAAALRFDPHGGAGREIDDGRSIAALPSPAALVASADRALYAAKAAGRDRAFMLSDHGALVSATSSAA
jgi:diguanylate cyclase (GGDEF)-like protein